MVGEILGDAGCGGAELVKVAVVSVIADFSTRLDLIVPALRAAGGIAVGVVGAGAFYWFFLLRSKVFKSIMPSCFST